jgi:hypothetical protein
MSKMAEIYGEIENLLRQGYKPITIAGMLQVPVDWVYSMEDDLMQLADPRSYGSDYE